MEISGERCINYCTEICIVAVQKFYTWSNYADTE